MPTRRLLAALWRDQCKSLEGGTLMLTPLLGPRADNPTVYAMGPGQIERIAGRTHHDRLNNLTTAYSLGETTGSTSGRTRAKAMDQVHVQVEIPSLYRENPIRFVSLLHDTPIQLASQSSRVVINEEKGIVVIGEDVEIAPVLVTHRNLSIDVGGRVPGFVSVNDVPEAPTNAKLKSLHGALNALHVPTEDLTKASADTISDPMFELFNMQQRS